MAEAERIAGTPGGFGTACAWPKGLVHARGDAPESVPHEMRVNRPAAWYRFAGFGWEMMMRVVRSSMVSVLSFCAVLAACTKEGPTVTPAPTGGVDVVATETPASAAAPVEDCTFETPLVPGVPGSPGHLIPSARNPNGHSELAALMRDMQDHMLAVRKDIAAGRALGPMPDKHARMRCAWPTTMSDRNAAFDAFAVNYMNQLAALHAPDHATPVAERYDAVLQACRACHENTCPGPIMAIDALARDRLPPQPTP